MILWASREVFGRTGAVRAAAIHWQFRFFFGMRKLIPIAVILGLLAIILIALNFPSPQGKSKANTKSQGFSTYTFSSPLSKWVSISYSDLLDSDTIVRTGQSLISALNDKSLRNAVQPFVDKFSALLPLALKMRNGLDGRAYHPVVDFFPAGSRQPAWAAIFRGGRINICTDDKNHAEVFLLGDDPKRAYQDNYTVIRHCLNMLLQNSKDGLQVDVYAYKNNYATSELMLNTEPYSFIQTAFPSNKKNLDLNGLAGFFAQNPELRGATLSKNRGFVLYGSEGPSPTLDGKPASLSDLAVAYRAVFHAGDNQAFISLDPNINPTKATVNFGGFLENTHIGSVVLNADERFKTITSGLDPKTFKDRRDYTRGFVKSFLTGSERDFQDFADSGKGKWISTRFWYYPDTIGVDSDLAYEKAVITNPRFTADAERSKGDFASPEEFERKKRETLSLSIRDCIADLNCNYAQYAKAFPEIAELSTVARLMGVCSWLYKAQANWLDCDELLSVELPPCDTEVDRTKLIAATYFCGANAEKPTSQQIIDGTKVVFLSPILDMTVEEYFHSPANVSKYLGSAKKSRLTPDEEAANLFATNREKKVRDILRTKDDVKLLADYAGSTIDLPLHHVEASLKSRIDKGKAVLARLKDSVAVLERGLSDQKAVISNLKSNIDAIKERMRLESNADAYNALVERHNSLVTRNAQLITVLNLDIDKYNTVIGEYELRRKQLNQEIDGYNDLSIQRKSVTEIGGGIDLAPSKFAIHLNPSSQKLGEFAKILPNIGRQWSVVVDGERWISSGNVGDALPTEPGGEVNRISQAASQIKRWTSHDASDGSWKEAIKLDESRSQEMFYNGQKHELHVAEFSSGQLASLLVAHENPNGRIVFQRSPRKNVLPPQDPPSWYSPN